MDSASPRPRVRARPPRERVRLHGAGCRCWCEREAQPRDAVVSSFDASPRSTVRRKRGEHRFQVLPVTSASLVHTVTRPDEGRQHGEVDQVSSPSSIEDDGVSGGLRDQRAEQTGPSHGAAAPVENDLDGLTPVQCLLGAWRLDRRPSRRAPSPRGPLPQMPRDEHVDLRLAAPPAVLVAFPGLAGRSESQVDERGRERVRRARLSSDVEDGVDVVSRARRRDAALDSVQVHHLAADECPPGWVAFGQVEEPDPRLPLPTGHRRHHDVHATGPDRDAAQSAMSSRARASSRGPSCSARSAASSRTGTGRSGSTGETCRTTLAFGPASTRR